MNGSNATLCEPPGSAPRRFFMLVYSLLFVAGLLLNGFSLKAYLWRTQRRNSVVVYLQNLAASDFLLSFSLPLRVVMYASDSAPVHWMYCNFGAVAFYLNMYASNLFLGLIAANRYLEIVRPLGAHVLRTVRGAQAVSALTWLFLLALSVPYVVLSLVTESGPPPPASFARSCVRMYSPQLRLYFRAVHSLSSAIFLLVLGSLVFFYHSTSRRLARALQRHPASADSQALVRARRNMAVLVAVFCVCFVPYHLVSLPSVYLKDLGCRGVTLLYFLRELAVMVSALNICLDPLIYFIFCKAFRAQLSADRKVGSKHAATQATTSTATEPAGHFNMRSRDGSLSGDQGSVQDLE